MMNRVHDETSEALLAAAHRLLVTDGPDALTVRRIATEAGMSTMNVYSRFGGKDGVIDELYAHGYDEMFKALDTVPETDDTLDDLLRVAAAYRTFAIGHPMYYEVMFGRFSASQQAVDDALAGLARFVARIERGAANGTIELPDDLDPTGATAWLWATCHGLLSLELDAVAADTIDWASIYRAAVRTALAGLAPATVTSSAT